MFVIRKKVKVKALPSALHSMPDGSVFICSNFVSQHNPWYHLSVMVDLKPLMSCITSAVSILSIFLLVFSLRQGDLSTVLCIVLFQGYKISNVLQAAPEIHGFRQTIWSNAAPGGSRWAEQWPYDYLSHKPHCFFVSQKSCLITLLN